MHGRMVSKKTAGRSAVRAVRLVLLPCACMGINPATSDASYRAALAARSRDGPLKLKAKRDALSQFERKST